MLLINVLTDVIFNFKEVSLSYDSFTIAFWIFLNNLNNEWKKFGAFKSIFVG